MTSGPTDPKKPFKYHYVLNSRYAMRIGFANLALTVGIAFLHRPDIAHSVFYGVGSLTIFCWLVFGSPFIRQLTPESKEHIRAWIDELAEYDDKNERE